MARAAHMLHAAGRGAFTGFVFAIVTLSKVSQIANLDSPARTILESLRTYALFLCKNRPRKPPNTSPPSPTYQITRFHSSISEFVNTFEDICKLAIFHCPLFLASVAVQREL